MRTQEFYMKISKNLEILAHRIKSGGKLNILDLNIHAETFYRDLLNIMYDWNLKSANVLTANAEAIDLIDEEKKIVCQISSTATKQKIESTLKKNVMKDYAENGYKLKFVFIADDAKSLRSKSYQNPFKVPFDSKKDIYDKFSVLTDISQLEFDRYASVNELFEKQFREKPNIERISNNLTSVVNLIANEDLSVVSYPTNLHEFNIDEKVDYNELGLIKETAIDEYKIYYNRLNRIYEIFDGEGLNKRLSVFRKVTGFYEKELVKDLSNVEKFFNIIESIKKYILESSNIEKFDEDILEMCIKIIVVDAFIRCKIFKNPKEYSHVITK